VFCWILSGPPRWFMTIFYARGKRCCKSDWRMHAAALSPTHHVPQMNC